MSQELKKKNAPRGARLLLSLKVVKLESRNHDFHGGILPESLADI